MKPCESHFSLILDFLYHRLDQWRKLGAICDAESFDSQQCFRDYATREINLLLWFSLIAITALLFRELVCIFKSWSQGSRIPGPPCPSFYGHSELFNGVNPLQDLTGLLVKSHEKYGSIVKLWLSPTQLLVSIKDPSLINEMLSKAVDKLPLTGRVYRSAFGQSSFFVSSFEQVKRGRESLARGLNGKLLEKASLMTDGVVDSLMERIYGIMDKGAVDCGMFSQLMAFSILGVALFDDAFFAWPKANVYEELLVRISKDACFWASYSIPPFWKWGYWKYQNLCTKLKILTQDIIQQCRMNYKPMCQPKWHCNSTITGVEEPSDRTYSSGKLEKSSPQEPCVHLNLWDEPCGNVMGVMFHGCLTTTGLISNILARLVLHPQLQEKIYSEVIMVRRQSDVLNKQDVSEMHLLLATVYESARLLPAGPLLQRCSLRQGMYYVVNDLLGKDFMDCDLELKNGMSIPAGAVLVAPIQSVQMDESNWGSDAGEFNPYRFLSKDEKNSELARSSKTTGAAEVPTEFGDESYVLSDRYKSPAFLPFGSGMRACVGEKFAVLGIASVFASLLERYEIKLLPGQSEPNPKPLFTDSVLQLVHSPKIVFVRRDV